MAKNTSLKKNGLNVPKWVCDEFNNQINFNVWFEHKLEGFHGRYKQILYKHSEW